MDFVVGYYVFTAEQYFLHTVQHTSFCTKHKHRHHRTYDAKDITKIKRNFSLYDNLDLYFNGNIVVLLGNSFIFPMKTMGFQLILAYLSYYFHNEYHTNNSIWEKWRFFRYLKRKHHIHHLNPSKNHFLIDPIFDIIFGTYG
tara:strand:+ start:79 stop:504 length:426 start_codon:yes stop_codon:yes gene_type:complete